MPPQREYRERKTDKGCSTARHATQAAPDTHTHTQRERHRQTDTDHPTERETDTDPTTQRDRHTQTAPHTHTHRHRRPQSAGAGGGAPARHVGGLEVHARAAAPRVPRVDLALLLRVVRVVPHKHRCNDDRVCGNGHPQQHRHGLHHHTPPGGGTAPITRADVASAPGETPPRQRGRGGTHRDAAAKCATRQPGLKPHPGAPSPTTRHHGCGWDARIAGPSESGRQRVSTVSTRALLTRRTRPHEETRQRLTES